MRPFSHCSCHTSTNIYSFHRDFNIFCLIAFVPLHTLTTRSLCAIVHCGNVTIFWLFQVHHGQKQNAAPLQPWIVLETNGQVHAAHCTCMAGLGEACSHVAAVLFYLMASWDKIQQTSCTSQPCSWLMPGQGTKRKGQPLCSTDFTNPLTKFKKGSQRQSDRAVMQPGPGPSATEKEAFLQSLVTACPKASILKVWPGFAQSEDVQSPLLPMDMATLYDSALEGLDIETLEEKAREMLDTMTCSEEQRANANRLTVDQSKSSEWFRLRVGRVTASNLKKVLHTDPEAPAPSLLADICSARPSSAKTPAIVWGKANEENALQTYSAVRAQEHEQFQLRPSGLWVSCEVPYLAGSPDGLVECRCCGSGVAEVKCPYRLRDSTADEFLADRNSCMSVDDDGVAFLKRDHQYYFQIQAQMFVCGVQYCDFVVHTNSFTMIERVMYDSAFILERLPKVRLFMNKAVLPQLMAHHFMGT